jgi:hypothetical protein
VCRAVGRPTCEMLAAFNAATSSAESSLGAASTGESSDARMVVLRASVAGARPLTTTSADTIGSASSMHRIAIGKPVPHEGRMCCPNYHPPYMARESPRGKSVRRRKAGCLAPVGHKRGASVDRTQSTNERDAQDYRDAPWSSFPTAPSASRNGKWGPFGTFPERVPDLGVRNVPEQPLRREPKSARSSRCVDAAQKTAFSCPRNMLLSC